METIKLSDTDIETLKKYHWEGVDNDSFCTSDLDYQFFYNLTGLSADFLNLKFDDGFYEATYRKEEKKENDGSISIVYIMTLEYNVGSNTVYSNATHYFYTDFLELFTEKQQEKTEEESFIDYLLGFVGERADNAVIELIKTNCPCFWSSLVDYVVENLTSDDLPGSLIEECGENYIDDSPAECLDRAAEKCYEEDVKNFIVTYLKNNL